jgi:hypothetical protein
MEPSAAVARGGAGAGAGGLAAAPVTLKMIQLCGAGYKLSKEDRKQLSEIRSNLANDMTEYRNDVDAPSIWIIGLFRDETCIASLRADQIRSSITFWDIDVIEKGKGKGQLLLAKTIHAFSQKMPSTPLTFKLEVETESETNTSGVVTNLTSRLIFYFLCGFVIDTSYGEKSPVVVLKDGKQLGIDLIQRKDKNPFTKSTFVIGEGGKDIDIKTFLTEHKIEIFADEEVEEEEEEYIINMILKYTPDHAEALEDRIKMLEARTSVPNSTRSARRRRRRRQTRR